jgi:hypothetical protein
MMTTELGESPVNPYTSAGSGAAIALNSPPGSARNPAPSDAASWLLAATAPDSAGLPAFPVTGPGAFAPLGGCVFSGATHHVGGFTIGGLPATIIGSGS